MPTALGRNGVAIVARHRGQRRLFGPAFEEDDGELGDGAAVVASSAVAGHRGLGLAGADPPPTGRQEPGQHPSADQPEAASLVGDDTGGLDDLVAGGLEGHGKAAAVRVGASCGLGGLRHHRPQHLVERQQRPPLLVKSSRII